MSPRNDHLFAILLAVSMAACVPPGAVSGGAFSNAQPANGIAMTGAYDFDMLAEISGRGCVKRGDTAGPNSVRYWFAGDGTRIAGEPLVSTVRGLAMLDALADEKGVDTIFVTRFIVTSKGDETCGEVFGRGIRYKKAVREPTPTSNSGSDSTTNPTEPDAS